MVQVESATPQDARMCVCVCVNADVEVGGVLGVYVLQRNLKNV